MTGKWHRQYFPDSVLIISGVIIIFVIPGIAGFPAGCIFNKITGLYCAGCGFCRGIHSILRGDLHRAIHQNFLIFSAFPLFFIWMAIRFFKLRKYSEYNSPGCSFKRYDMFMIVFFIIIVILFMLARNIPLPFLYVLRPV